MSKMTGSKLRIVSITRFAHGSRIEPLRWSIPMREHFRATINLCIECRSTAHSAVFAAWSRAWPPAALAVAVIVDVACIVLLGYGIAKAALG